MTDRGIIMLCCKSSDIWRCGETVIGCMRLCWCDFKLTRDLETLSKPKYLFHRETVNEGGCFENLSQECKALRRGSVRGAFLPLQFQKVISLLSEYFEHKLCYSSPCYKHPNCFFMAVLHVKFHWNRTSKSAGIVGKSIGFCPLSPTP